MTETETGRKKNTETGRKTNKGTGRKTKSTPVQDYFLKKANLYLGGILSQKAKPMLIT